MKIITRVSSKSIVGGKTYEVPERVLSPAEIQTMQDKYKITHPEGAPPLEGCCDNADPGKSALPNGKV